MIAKWNASPNPPDQRETCKRLIDLFLVSVLLDAGAGNSWVYREESSGDIFTRSEGLGVASVHMFEQGLFSGNSEQPFRVDGKRGLHSMLTSPFFDTLPLSATGLSRVTVENTAIAMQVNDSNPMVGLQGRASLLYNLGSALKSNPTFFGQDARPGNLIGEG
jgi:hypothetical protein